MTIIEKAQKDGTYNEATRWLVNVDLDQLRMRLEVKKTKEERAKLMLILYPGLFFLVAMRLGEDIS